MPTIHLTTVIHAPVERVFDICRNVDLHKKSLAHTNEQATAGTYTGLLDEGDIVTWKARHLRKDRFLKVRILKLEKYSFFVDDMIQGDFAAYKHEHYFKAIDNGTIVINILNFETPYGLLGVLVNRLFLTRYLKHLLEHRLTFIKNYAETEAMKASIE